jgi:hypothetical protein
MASKYWVKLYVELLDDPKMGLLPDRLWRRFAECLLLAKDHDDTGALPPMDHAAWRLKTEVTQLEQEFAELVELGLLAGTRNGGYRVTRFAKRQKARTSTERVREHRKRKRHGNDSETQSERDSTEESRREEESEEEVRGEIDDDEESSSVPEILDMHCAVLRITGQNPTTAQVEELWEAGVTESRVMLWYTDQEHGWPKHCPSNATRKDPWISQVLEHAPGYRTHAERIAESVEEWE